MLNRMFNMENDFWMFANKVADMVILELVWLVCCIPVVTAGAAGTAFWHVFVRMAKDQEGRVLSNYFHVFKSRFWTGTGIGLIKLTVGLFFLADIWVCLRMGTAQAMFLAGVLGMLLLFWLLCSMWFYPLAGTFPFSLKKVLGNSVYLTMRHLPYGMACLALSGGALFLSVKIPYGIILLPALGCYVNAKVFAWIFSRYEDGKDGA